MSEKVRKPGANIVFLLIEYFAMTFIRPIGG
jgi:hypothetical protein